MYGVNIAGFRATLNQDYNLHQDFQKVCMLILSSNQDEYTTCMGYG